MTVFNKRFFEKNQKTLVKLANTPFLRWFLGITRLPSEIKSLPIHKITPNSIHSVKLVDGEYIIEAHCFTSPRFAEALAFNLTPFVYLMNLRSTRYTWKFSPVGFITSLGLLLAAPKFGLIGLYGTVTDYYAGTGDGYVNYNNATYSTCRSAATGNASASGVSSIDASLVARSILFSGQYYSSRGFFPIDTSSITSASTITAATMSQYIEVSSKYDTNSDSFAVIQTSQASTSTLATTDFGAVTFTNGGSKTIASFSVANQYWVWTLNATGLTYINKTGFSKLGLLSLNEINNSAPTGLNQLGGPWYFADNTGTSKDPYISVTYTLSAVDTNALMMGMAF